MGQRKSAPTEDDNSSLSSWGSDIDRAFCGPGKICDDEWTPLGSEDGNLDRDMDTIITEQPYLSELQSPYVMSSFLNVPDNDEIHENELQEPPKIEKAKKKRKRKKKLKRTPVHRITHSERRAADEGSANDYIRTPKRFTIYKTKRIQNRQRRTDPRYPTIPPPRNSNIVFIKSRKSPHQSKVVPPNHLKGFSVTPPQPFRYRGLKHKIY